LNPHGGATCVAIIKQEKLIGGLIIRSAPPVENIEEFISSGKEHFKTTYNASSIEYHLYETPLQYQFHHIKGEVKLNGETYIVESYTY
jgi:hypothetical protein